MSICRGVPVRRPAATATVTPSRRSAGSQWTPGSQSHRADGGLLAWLGPLPGSCRQRRVRRRRARRTASWLCGGGDWGEAILTEFAETTGDWETARWAASGLRAVRHERGNRARELPRIVRIRRRAALIARTGIVGSLIVNQYVLTGGILASGGMEPAYEITDRYLLDRLAFRVTGVHHGDVIENDVNGGILVRL